MGFQTHINREPPLSKQNFHQIDYTANGVSCKGNVRTSQIKDEKSAISISMIMSFLLSKHPAETEIILQSILDRGLQNVEVL